MSLEILDFLAFTNSPKGGNRAAVVFGLDMESTRKMQSLASSIGAPVTVFVGVSETLFRDEAAFPLRLRFFTPEIEEDLCEHGAIAALHAIMARRQFQGFAFPSAQFLIETALGFQSAKFDYGFAWLEYPQPSVQNLEDDLPNLDWNHALELREVVATALGLDLDDLHEDLPVMVVNAGCSKLMCGVPSTVFLDAIEPDHAALIDLCKTTNTTGILAFTFPGRDAAFTDMRHFSYQQSVLEDATTGVLEDVVTGNAHAALAGYLTHQKFFDDGERAFTGVQGYALGQPSRLEVRFTATRGEAHHVWVGGKAVQLKEETV